MSTNQSPQERTKSERKAAKKQRAALEFERATLIGNIRSKGGLTTSQELTRLNNVERMLNG